MYSGNAKKPFKSSLRVYQAKEGEPIETKVERIVNNKEPIKDAAPIIYTDRKDGVKPEFNIRTDRFEVAVENMDKVAQVKLTERDKRHKKVDAKEGQEGNAGEGSAGAAPDGGGEGKA